MKKILFVLSLVAFASFGQNVDFKAGNFKDKKDEFKKIVEKMDGVAEKWDVTFANILKGQNRTRELREIYEVYKEVQDFNPNNAELNFKIGVIHFFALDMSKAKNYYLTAEKLDKACSEYLPYFLGLSYQTEGDFKKARTYYRSFETTKAYEEHKSLIKKRKAEMANYERAESNPVRAWVDPVDELNTAADEWGPVGSMDGEYLLFSSNRVVDGKEPNVYGEYDYDVYQSELVNGTWTEPELVKELSTDLDDLTSWLSPTGDKALINQDQGGGNLDIFQTLKQGTTWGMPTPIKGKPNSVKYAETFPVYSLNERWLFYQRQTDNSKRGSEVFETGMVDEQKKVWGDGRKNSQLSSGYDEGSIYFHPDDRTCYIASKGWDSFGGYDLFVSKKDNTGWTAPVNMGYPINTPADDLFFAADGTGKIGYLASNREGGKGGYDIYKVTFWGDEKQHEMPTQDYLLAGVAKPLKDESVGEEMKVDVVTLTVFKGVVIDAITNKPVAAEIEIIDNNTGKVVMNLNTDDIKGKFLISLNSGANYGVAVKADGYLFHSENVNIPMGTASQMITKTIKLKNICIGCKIALQNVFFETGKSDLKPESYIELDRVVSLMTDVPSLVVEIGGHTDNTGSVDMNIVLSKDRAKAVMNYLVSKGIKANRLKSEGYGDSKPVASNSTSSGRAQNRRTECIILAN